MEEFEEKKVGGGKIFLGSHNIYPCVQEGSRDHLHQRRQSKTSFKYCSDFNKPSKRPEEIS